MLCNYGCGREAKFFFKNGKGCCSISQNSCSEKRNKQSKIMLEVCNNDEYINKQRQIMLDFLEKETIEEKDNRYKKRSNNHQNKTEDEKRLKTKKMIDGMKERGTHEKRKNNLKTSLGKPETRKKLSINISKGRSTQEFKEKLRIKFTITIDKIKERCPTFFENEEVRYNPENQEMLQVRCKNKNCINSMENDGWFEPTRKQLVLRMGSINTSRGWSFFFCSNECKNKSEWFHVKISPERLKEYEKYLRLVYKETYKSVKEYSNKIENSDLRGFKYGYDLDHKYSINDGFKNNIEPKIIGHYKNLEVLKNIENRNYKRGKSSIALKQLIKEIESIGA